MYYSSFIRNIGDVFVLKRKRTAAGKGYMGQGW
jgi:hypothetical protein